MLKKRNRKNILHQIRLEYLQRIFIYYIKEYYKGICNREGCIKSKIKKVEAYSRGDIIYGGTKVTWPLDLIDDNQEDSIYYDYNTANTNIKFIAPTMFENTLFDILCDIIVICTELYNLYIINNRELKEDSFKLKMLEDIHISDNNGTDIINEILFYLGSDLQLKNILTYDGELVIVHQ